MILKVSGMRKKALGELVQTTEKLVQTMTTDHSLRLRPLSTQAALSPRAAVAGTCSILLPGITTTLTHAMAQVHVQMIPELTSTMPVVASRCNAATAAIARAAAGTLVSRVLSQETTWFRFMKMEMMLSYATSMKNITGGLDCIEEFAKKVK